VRRRAADDARSEPSAEWRSFDTAQQAEGIVGWVVAELDLTEWVDARALDSSSCDTACDTKSERTVRFQ
jgi:hypothetical protein